MARKPAARKPRKAPAATHDYPRMQLRREQWTNLNGPWDFAIDADAQLSSPRDVAFDRTIEVPYSPETPLSGVEETGFFSAVWYRRAFATPPLEDGQRLVLHFGAVDHIASVWVNDSLAVTHEGGYTPFQADITDLLTDSGDNTIIVRAFDDPADLAKPRGKQDWRLEPHSIWYGRTTGIWQTVWMEIVPAVRIESLRWTANMERWSIDLSARLSRIATEPLRLRVTLSHGKTVLASDEYSIAGGTEVSRTIALPDGGIEDIRNDLFWWPWKPNLIDARIELIDESGTTLDTVQSYTAMRSVDARGDRLLLNGKPLQLKLLLDQGYWNESGLTPPGDDAIRRDIELVKQMGFNGVRKHQKLEDPRFLYWADRLGLLVWEEMPSPYRFSSTTVARLTSEWLAAMERDISHPCIIAWVPFNESWGVPDLPTEQAQRDFVRGVYYLTKSIDPTRPVIGNDGWEMVVSDIIAVHDYERVPDLVRSRYLRENLEQVFAHERPGHRQLLLDGLSPQGKPLMLTEFGGIAFSKDVKHTWGYKRAATQAEFRKQYTDLLAAVRSCAVFGGFCYTQFTDTYQEANGLLYMDRTPKFPIEQIRKATEG